MKFYFSARPETPSMQSVFHFLVKEAGGDPQFCCERVTTEYEGTIEDEALKKLIKLYESQPECIITISTK